MPEGLSASEVGKEIAEHRKRGEEEGNGDAPTGDRWISIVEAVLLSLVAVLAAYSGFAAAKWGTKSSVSLAKASALRTRANRNDLEALQIRTLDSVSFNAWFTAFVAGNQHAELLAEKRLRPGYRPAFFAWLATDPACRLLRGPVIPAAAGDPPRPPPGSPGRHRLIAKSSGSHQGRHVRPVTPASSEAQATLDDRTGTAQP